MTLSREFLKFVMLSADDIREICGRLFTRGNVPPNRPGTIMVSLFRTLFEPIADHLVRAKKYLDRQGFRIITKGYRFAGVEVDFVGQDGSVLMLVLVRTRGPVGIGGRHDDDDEVDHESLRQAAEKWIAEHPEVEAKEVRLDVIRLDWYGTKRGEPVLRYFPGAIPITTRFSGQA